MSALVLALVGRLVPTVPVMTRRRFKGCERKAGGGWDLILPVLPVLLVVVKRCFRLVGLWQPLRLVVEEMSVGVPPVLSSSNKSSVPIPLTMTMPGSHPTATQQLRLRLGKRLVVMYSVKSILLSRLLALEYAAQNLLSFFPSN